MEYGAAKRRAARDLGVNARNGELPGNDEIEDEVRAYLDLFHADTPARRARRAAPDRRPLDGKARRIPAAPDRRRLARHGDAAEQHLHRPLLRRLEVGRDRTHRPAHRLRRQQRRRPARPRPRRPQPARAEREDPGGVHVALTVRDYDDLRGALHRDARGRSDRGDLAALRSREAGGMNRRLVVLAGAGARRGSDRRRHGLATRSPGRRGQRTRPWYRSTSGGSNSKASTARRSRWRTGAAGRCCSTSGRLGAGPASSRCRCSTASRANRSPRGWQVLALAVDQADPVRRFIAERTLTLPVAIAGAIGLDLSRQLGNVSGGLPFTAAFDSTGAAVQRRLGTVSRELLAGWKASMR